MMIMFLFCSVERRERRVLDGDKLAGSVRYAEQYHVLQRDIYRHIDRQTDRDSMGYKDNLSAIG